MNNDQSLATTLGQFHLQNPFLLSSAPPTASYEQIRRAFSVGWAGAVVKTIRPDGMVIEDVSPRFQAIKGSSGDIQGFENIELLSKKTLSYWTSHIPRLKEEFPGRLLVASIMGTPDPAEWRSLAGQVEEAGSDAIEMNVSCPHGMPEQGVGAAIGQNPEMVRDLTRAVKSAVEIPVIVKLTPNVTDILPIARAAAAGGADMISAINTVQCLSGIDLNSFEPLPSVAGYSTYGGYSGPAIKPIGLRVVSQVASAVDLPVIGIGGISGWRDAAEYLLAGASAVQVCTAVMWNGFGIVREMQSGLSSYLARKGVSTPDRLRGLALGRLHSHQSLDRAFRVRPTLSTPELCTSCGRCVIACRDGGYHAIALNDGKPEFDHARCDGCSLCSHVCPEGALILSREG
ncbi:MAG: dihydropyrimidine dehydrogenase subunit B [Methanoregulaceae archaeon PtaU1.Bin059]|nr:MAG: dihydropyrimidine dehydrogenase subunit B [Methanoregulaceae archaeon PtaB.Bin152]OPY39966.1 MAG: dihydropyrimidine dehydrogenase subunit B [Methanoregulaceae archaeon PtaU1.Bin059]